MGQPYVGEIKMFAGDFAPDGWMFCNGQLLQIVDYDTLFYLIGTTYGGDGETTFALPDLRGRFPVHMGNNSVATHSIGERAGTEAVTLTTQQLPAHSHLPICNTTGSNDSRATNNVWGAGRLAFNNSAPDASMNSSAIASAGANQPHENMPPFLAVNFIISLFGIYPTQT